MNRKPRYLIGVFAVVAALLMAALPASAQSNGSKSQASDIGVTASAVHIAVIADVDNPFAPGLFQGVVDGVKGAATYLNSKAGGGGVAGRKLVVDFIDSKLNANDSRNAVITACQQDFAMVGTSTLLLSNVDDEINCPDSSGAATGLPDMGAIVTGVPQSCSPVSFPVNPPQLVCATKDQSPQTYNGNDGDSKYLLKKHKDLHGAFVNSSDSKDANRGGAVLIDAAQKAGIKNDQTVAVSGRQPQSQFTPVVGKMKQDGSNYSYITTGTGGAIQLRSEAQLQNVSSDVQWVCVSACYDKEIAANPVMDGEHVSLTFLPFEETSTNPTLASFVKYVGKDKINGFAVYGWTATLAFAQAAKAAIATGDKSLTRKALLSDGIPSLTKFDAGGMIGAVNIPGKIPSSCFMMVQLKNRKFVREYPSKRGTFDCKASNKVQIKADLING